jgi:hypothetical protein
MFTPIVKHDKDKITGEYANKYPPTLKAKIPYNSLENKFDFDCYDMDNNETNFHDILANLKGGKAQFIIQLSGIWFSAGMFGCSWKIVSAKFQQLNTSKLTFVVDSDDELNNVDEDDDDISVDNDVIAKITQKSSAANAANAVSDKKTLVEKQPVVVAVAAPATLKPVQKVIPQEEEDDDDDEDDDALENVDEEGEDEEEEEEPVKVVEEPVKPVQETKVKKASATKKK